MQWRENRKNQIHLKNPLALPASVHILTPTRPAEHGKPDSTLKNRKQTTMQQTKKQQTARFFNLMSENGFTYNETTALLKAERALRKWGELECGTGDGNRSVHVFRDEETGKPFYRVEYRVGNEWKERVQPKRDTEKAALAKVEAIMSGKTGFRAYHQTDPRGCALYIIRPGDIEAGENVHALYNRGIALCVA